jgi:cytoskeleton protein RodZ
VVGRADVVDVEVRGLPFNLSVVAKENVARFEVK